ncbi:Transposase-like protein [Thioalkalivibrio nitratireducens DSM 14787]|uniref:Transposase-like protein n=1 Tax=Thioalkalivibrio nitratireducens (strain DSM 14787 / UNIQEM 213 / ALEN2) TaxID=1255043 RepID=L0DTB0_THIND|nr:Transposase-like protein [Thioalkalivibrio nitratireducens DSM 14787]
MPYPRSSLVSLEATPWYHVISRCVRRAFLCGEDLSTGRNFEHRRGWIVARMEQLAGVFAVDVAAYAVMSNHFHQVVRVDAERAQGWSDDEVLRRWTRLYTGPELVQQYLRDGGAGLVEAQLEAVQGWAATYRARLGDLSWYMRVLNESISRMANAEDGVTGRFWEGRFKSHALLDEAAVLTAMAQERRNGVRSRMRTSGAVREPQNPVPERQPLPRQPLRSPGSTEGVLARCTRAPPASPAAWIAASSGSHTRTRLQRGAPHRRSGTSTGKKRRGTHLRMTVA